MDGKEYGAGLLRRYARDVMAERPTTRGEFFGILQKMAFDLAAYPEIERTIAQLPLSVIERQEANRFAA